MQGSIYAPSGRQGIASAGLVSTRTVTILAPSFFRFATFLITNHKFQQEAGKDEQTFRNGIQSISGYESARKPTHQQFAC